MPSTRTRSVPRSELVGIFKTPRLLEFAEALGEDVGKTLPGIDAEQDVRITNAQDTADAAGAAAVSAAADAAAAAGQAFAAQSDANTLKALTYVVVTPDVFIPNARQLAVGSGLTIDTATPGILSIVRSDPVFVLGSDFVESSGAFSATGLQIPVEANSTYVFDGLISFESAAVTTGVGFSFSIPAGATIVGGYFHNVTNTTMEGSYNIATNATKGDTTSVQTANQKIPVIGRWLVNIGATAGTAELRVRTEVATSAVTVHQGSVITARKIA